MKKFYKFLFSFVVLAGLTTGFVASLISLKTHPISFPIYSGIMYIWIAAGGSLVLFPLIFGAIQIYRGQSKKVVLLSLISIITITVSPILIYMHTFFPALVKTISLPILILTLFSAFKLRYNTLFRKMHLNLAIAAVFLLFAAFGALTFDALGVNSLLMDKETNCLSHIERECQGLIGTKDRIQTPYSCTTDKPTAIDEPPLSPHKSVIPGSYETAKNGSKIICNG